MNVSLRNSTRRVGIPLKSCLNYTPSASSLTRDRRQGWQSIIGLEVHAQIDTDSKLFSPASLKYGAPVNSKVALFDAAIPGTLPVINRGCVEASVLTSLALSCRINSVSSFDRKHYFYADLPAGYQITQQRFPIGIEGYLNFPVSLPENQSEPYSCMSRIRQIQLEQDSGKSLHDEDGKRSLIDLNRAGAPLMEIVFYPDLASGEEAGALVKELSLILLRLGTCNCKMEEGSLRVDANISVNPTGDKLGTRTEVKNLGTIRSIVNAIEFEIDRQISVLSHGGVIVNETRGYDAVTKTTLPMRDKEAKQEYRFMPEPNIPPLRLNLSASEIHPKLINVEILRQSIPELPDVTRERLVKKYNLRFDAAIKIVSTPGLLVYYETVMESIDPKFGVRVANVLQILMLGILNDLSLTFEDSPVPPNVFTELFELIAEDKVNLDKTKETLSLLVHGDKRSPTDIINDNNWTQLDDDEIIEVICRKVMSQNPDIVRKYTKSGHTKHHNKLMGAVRKVTESTCNMQKVDKILKRLMDEEKNKL